MKEKAVFQILTREVPEDLVPRSELVLLPHLLLRDAMLRHPGKYAQELYARLELGELIDVAEEMSRDAERGKPPLDWESSRDWFSRSIVDSWAITIVQMPEPHGIGECWFAAMAFPSHLKKVKLLKKHARYFVLEKEWVTEERRHPAEFVEWSIRGQRIPRASGGVVDADGMCRMVLKACLEIPKPAPLSLRWFK